MTLILKQGDNVGDVQVDLSDKVEGPVWGDPSKAELKDVTFTFSREQGLHGKYFPEHADLELVFETGSTTFRERYTFTGILRTEEVQGILDAIMKVKDLRMTDVSRDMPI